MKKYLVVLLLCWGVSAVAQVGLWNSVGVSKKINKKLKAEGSSQLRWADNLTFAQTYLAELGLSYKIVKNLELAGFYRYIDRRKSTTANFKTRNRFYADLSYGHSLGKFKLEDRLRYQHQFKDNDGVAEFDASYIRNKVGLSYAVNKKLSPYVSADWFYNVQGATIDQIRGKVGFDYKLNKKNAFDIGVLNNFPIPSESGGLAPIFALGYQLKL